MTEDMVWILIFGAIGLVLVSIAAYYIMRFLKGSIKLHLDKRGFNLGEVVKGSFVLNTKKEIMGNTLTVALIGTKHIKYHDDNKDDRNRDTTIEIYNNQVMIEQGMTYSAGFSQKYDFEIVTPPAPQTSENKEDGLNSSAFKMTSSAMQFMSDKSISYSWKVEVRLDIDGVDIATSEKVFVNMDNVNL